jgi:fumarylacetoacetase
MLAGLAPAFRSGRNGQYVTTVLIDDTHLATRKSWVDSANGHSDFPIQNLPFGIFSRDGSAPRAGVAIGDKIFDLQAADAKGLFGGIAAEAINATRGGTLNAFLALGSSARHAVRSRLVGLLDADGAERSHIEALASVLLHDASTCTMHLPVNVGDYTDFYAGIHHATNVGKILRPDNPLLPNYKYVPIAYHGRASSVRVSSTPVARPSGQTKNAEESVPRFGPSQRLDIELELGIWIGRGNALGHPIPINEAADHLAGFCLLNDWSARDIQAWEYQPLGPFVAKNFMTSVSSWVVTPEALAPFRTNLPPREPGDPPPLPYLVDETDQAEGALNLTLEVSFTSAQMRAKGQKPKVLSQVNAAALYWTPAQMVTHHTSGGCDLRPGDLLGTGTISGSTADTLGSLLEMTRAGQIPIQLETGEVRRFLEDGDEITLRARAYSRDFAPIGFGECRGRIASA